MNITTNKTIVVSLTEVEAFWLKTLVQNPPQMFSVEMDSFCRELFEALKLARVGAEFEKEDDAP